MLAVCGLRVVAGFSGADAGGVWVACCSEVLRC